MYGYRLNYILGLHSWVAEFLRTWPVWQIYTNSDGDLVRVMGVKFDHQGLWPIVAVYGNDDWQVLARPMSMMWDLHPARVDESLIKALPSVREHVPILQIGITSHGNYHIPGTLDVVTLQQPPPSNSPVPMDDDIPLATGGGGDPIMQSC